MPTRRYATISVIKEAQERILWKAITFLCGYLLLCGVVYSLCGVVYSLCGGVSSLCGEVSSLCLVVTSLCLVVTSLYLVVTSLCGLFIM